MILAMHQRSSCLSCVFCLTLGLLLTGISSFKLAMCLGHYRCEWHVVVLATLHSLAQVHLLSFTCLGFRVRLVVGVIQQGARSYKHLGSDHKKMAGRGGGQQIVLRV